MNTLRGLTLGQRFFKRMLDLAASFFGLLIVWPALLIGWLLASISTRSGGLFVQQRVGRNGQMFPLLKLRSMVSDSEFTTSVTASDDRRITGIGKMLRKLKIDELPQLVNVLVGQMSLVGPRPDVEGFADRLEGDDRIILTVRPGITGPASIAFRDEEELLAKADDPEAYNRDVIWPQKVRMNVDYIHNYSLLGDLSYVWQTVFGRQDQGEA